MATRRRRGEDSITFDHQGPCRDPERHRHCPGRWRGEIALGYNADGSRKRKRVTGTTKTIVQDRLKELHADLDAGVESPAGCTVRKALDDWLAEGLDGRSAETIRRNRSLFYSRGAGARRSCGRNSRHSPGASSAR